jgi:hypothetical protein
MQHGNEKDYTYAENENSIDNAQGAGIQVERVL